MEERNKIKYLFMQNFHPHSPKKKAFLIVVFSLRRPVDFESLSPDESRNFDLNTISFGSQGPLPKPEIKLNSGICAFFCFRTFLDSTSTEAASRAMQQRQIKHCRFSSSFLL